MHIKTRNVNTAFRELLSGICGGTIATVRTSSRYGEVLRIAEPLVITYEHPSECILFNQSRDSNVFFTLYEALWLLAGRRDVAPLSYYNSKMPEFSDDGVTYHGSYGYRWRKHFGFDQLDMAASELRDNPTTRRVVVAMWDATVDLPYACTKGTKDLPCNLEVVFEVEDDHLNITVFNRSNDIVWGLLGTNVVQFTFLQMYMAARLGLKIGVYHQISSNAHVYTDRFEPEKWLAWYNDTSGFDGKLSGDGDYSFTIKTIPLVKDPATFDRECAEFVERHSRDALAGDYKEPFLELVAQPMMIAFHWHKRRDYSAALACIETVQSDDWRIAATNWLLKRKANHEHKQGI